MAWHGCLCTPGLRRCTLPYRNIGHGHYTTLVRVCMHGGMYGELLLPLSARASATTESDDGFSLPITEPTLGKVFVECLIKKYSTKKVFVELYLPSVTLDKNFVKCFPDFAAHVIRITRQRIRSRPGSRQCAFHRLPRKMCLLPINNAAGEW